MDDSLSPAALPKNNAVTAVAMANIALGVLRIALSVGVAFYLLGFLLEGPGTDPDLLKIVGLFALVIMLPILLVIGLISIVAGVVLIVTGLGLLRRSRVSRIVTLVLGGMGGGLAAIYGMQLVDELTNGATLRGVAISVAGLVIHGAYCVLVFVVLLNRRNATEFI